ncbi:MAG: exonuclease domain-containing protein [Candidatus Omnitrophota bacterium]
MDGKIDDLEITVFDTETTGLEPASGDRIVEIAGIRLKGQERLGVFQSLINPGRPVSAGAFEVNGISSQMLESAPKPEEAMPQFLDFIKGSLLCSYNIAFDLGFLNSELKIIGRSLPEEKLEAVDILKMARRLMPGLERYALWFVAEKLGIKAKQKHRAFSDVEMTLGVFEKLKGMLFAKGISDAASFSSLFGAGSSGALEDINARKIAEIQQAMDLGVQLKIKYISASNAEVSERQVVPKEIRYQNNRSYLVGYCCLKREERTFRIDGILHLEAV